jgi:type II secretory pathway component GspD/PulD (secretin)
MPLAAALAQYPAGQKAGRVYRFTGSEPSIQGYQELATVIRTVADIPKLSIDSNAREIDFSGPGETEEMAQWLLHELDRTAGSQSAESAPAEYHSPSKDDRIAVFYLAHIHGVQFTQEVITVLRTVADAQKVFTYTALDAVVVRAPTEQMALAKWMISALDREAPSPGAEVPEFHISGVRDPIARVYYLANAKNQQDVNRIVTAVRTTGGIMKVFPVSTNGALVMRGPQEQITKAEGIVNAMDRELAR